MHFPPQAHVPPPQYPAPQLVRKGANVFEVILAMIAAGIIAFTGGLLTGRSMLKAEMESRYQLVPLPETGPAPAPAPNTAPSNDAPKNTIQKKFNIGEAYGPVFDDDSDTRPATEAKSKPN